MKALLFVALLVGQYANPKPLDTAVRLHAGSSWGSGTVVYSDSATTLILSCAHVFRESTGQRIVAEFFGPNRGLSAEAKLVSWDAEHDLSLLVAWPRKQLPASRIAPKSWHARPRHHVYVVGCEEARAPTLYTTMVIRPRVEMQLIETAYTGIETNRHPGQGRSGGGLFSDDFYVIGVCNFGGRSIGLFADPASINDMLDRQGLSGLHTLPNQDPGLVQCQAQVQRRFGWFAGIVGRRNAFGMYGGPRPVDSTCIGGYCVPPQPVPAPSPVPMPSPVPVDPTPAPVISVPTPIPAPPPAPTVDLSAIEKRLAALEAGQQVLNARSMMPIKVGVTHPDGRTSESESYPDYHPSSPHQSDPKYRGRVGINLFSAAPTPGKP